MRLGLAADSPPRHETEGGVHSVAHRLSRAWWSDSDASGFLEETEIGKLAEWVYSSLRQAHARLAS